MESQQTEDWSSTTWDGSRLENLRRWQKLTLKERLEAAEEIEALGRHFASSRHKNGLPYFDPDSGELVDPS
ncbi:MAG: hypothetical protein AAGA58_16835 [Verrucomicrobiota bacterium]